ncbi:MAG: hypothetical protein O3B21_02640 [Proteobacteria bacterium]|nr:hypothetical protein [Pseudomonadota bacterium]MDA1354695.1 hypothetical protein [Pseudomonadota bacterium]
MYKILAISVFAGVFGGIALLATPGANAATAISLSETAVIDVAQDMSLIHQVRSNRYKEQMRHHLQMGRRGDANALRQLAFHYSKGWGVIRDLTKAYMWFTLAGMQGSQDALENRETIATALSGEQIARAEAMAERWQAAYEWEIEAGHFGG